MHERGDRQGHHERLVRATRHGYLTKARELQHDERIAGRHVGVAIAVHGAHGHDLDIRSCREIQDGEGVVDANVHVKDHAAGHGTGSLLRFPVDGWRMIGAEWVMRLTVR